MGHSNPVPVKGKCGYGSYGLLDDLTAYDYTFLICDNTLGDELTEYRANVADI